MSSKKCDRSRNWFLVSYAPIDFIKKVCQEHTNVRAYAVSPYHDADLDEAGNLKTPHYHISLILYDARDSKCVRNYFRCFEVGGKEINTLADITIDIKATYDYLIHKNQPTKHPYNIEDIICSNKKFFEEAEEINTSYLILEDMLNNVSLMDMVKRYGRDFVIHYKSYKELKFDIQYQTKCYLTQKGIEAFEDIGEIEEISVSKQ